MNVSVETKKRVMAKLNRQKQGGERMGNITTSKTVTHPSEEMSYCRVDVIPNVVEVFIDSYISPKIEAYYVSQGYKIIRHKTKCPWKKR